MNGVASGGASDVVVMREDATGISVQTNVLVGFSGAIQIGGTGELAHYYVANAANLHQVDLSALPMDKDISSGEASYLIISHPDFIGAGLLEDLQSDLIVEHGSAQIVDVELIYAQYGGHVFDPAAIQAFIKESVEERGTQNVLLVGGDVYDYRQFENEDATSFIPSIYAATGRSISFAPVDAKYVDLDDDNVPDLPIGRLPVRTNEQLRSLLSKRDSYLTRDYQGEVLLVADAFDELQQYDFGGDAQHISNSYLTAFNADEVYLDDVLASGQFARDARNQIAASINEGKSLTSFFGHSSTNQWSFTGLFSGNDAAGLNNVGRPTVVTQWGCWNAYYVNPNEDSMGHRFMMEGDQGAVAVMGATTLTNAASERRLAELVFAGISEGKTIGNAITDAKQEYAEDYPNDLDVLLGWTLLGLPDLVIN